MKRNILLFASVAISCAYADGAAPSQSLYNGYSPPVLQAPDVSPYGIVGAQDVYPLMTGYGLMQPTNDVLSINAPFIVNTPGKGLSKNQPNIIATTPTQLLVGSMLTGIPGDSSIASYLQQMDSAFESQNISSNTSFNNASSIVDNYNQNTATYTMTPNFILPYDASSLFHYQASSGGQKNDPIAYQVNPAEVYMSLVSGILTPQAAPENMTEADREVYNIKLRRIVATQTAGLHALEKIYKRSMPLSGFDTLLLQSLNNQTPATNPKEMPAPPNAMSARDLEKFMATRRLDPKSGWYKHLQESSPVELQREQLYLQAEMLYELYQVHQTEEENQLLLAVNLLSSNLNTGAQLGQQAKVSTASKTAAK